MGKAHIPCPPNKRRRRKGMVEVKEELKGDLFSNLPGLLTYKENTEVPVNLSVVNLSDATRTYMLIARTYDSTGRQISEGVVLVGGLAWFQVESEDREDVSGVISVEETNVTLKVFLIEEETNEVVDSIMTYLRGS